ncbi:hypothetical protein LCGC14_0404240 [marine sediment metagenome]|uniref:Uncharacterized protein n=1 Tax=marine sediment metagenome TaxID=412755 RepID=A0A0F9SVY5_9ZZZZ
MKKLLRTVMITLIGLILILGALGCQIVEDETGSHIRLNPFTHSQIGDAAQATTDILGMLSLFIPALAPIATAGAAGTYVWRRMGKEVTKYKTPLEHTVSVLDVVKGNKKLWNQLKPYLKGTAKGVWDKPSAATESTIRGIIDKNVGAV